MKIIDRIYGEIAITEPVIAEIIESKQFQRLKDISQDGACHYIQANRNGNRYEHCIGTWYLSRKYKRPLEEQIASLLHDLPHTAFSHVIDLVMDDKDHEYHDHFTTQIILQSTIPAILKKYNVSLEKVLHKEHYYLLENKLPDISVDRLDYFMRDGYQMNLIPAETITLFLTKLKEKNQRFYFEDPHVAGQFAVLFMNCSRLIWLDPTSHGSFFLMANALKIALKKEYITQDDFFLTDHVVMQKLRDANDAQINACLDRLAPGNEFVYASKEDAEFYGLNKPRFVDPWVKQGDTLVHVSQLIPGLTDYFQEFMTRYKNIGVKQKR